MFRLLIQLHGLDSVFQVKAKVLPHDLHLAPVPQSGGLRFWPKKCKETEDCLPFEANKDSVKSKVSLPALQHITQYFANYSLIFMHNRYSNCVSHAILRLAMWKFSAELT